MVFGCELLERGGLRQGEEIGRDCDGRGDGALMGVSARVVGSAMRGMAAVWGGRRQNITKVRLELRGIRERLYRGLLGFRFRFVRIRI